MLLVLIFVVDHTYTNHGCIIYYLKKILKVGKANTGVSVTSPCQKLLYMLIAKRYSTEHLGALCMKG